ncbi:MAG: EF-hand domain-containing protein [Cyclobacteriaceae bacterium]
MLSDFQTRKLSYLFTIYDHNRNGLLELDDFTDIAEQICDKLGYKAGSRHHEDLLRKTVRLFHHLMSEMPNIKGQRITDNDWINYFDTKIVSHHDEDLLVEYIEMMIGYLFDLFDFNNDGYISLDEYKDIFDIYGINRDYAEKAFHNLDLNSDGKLSRYELVRAIETFLISDDPLMKGNWIFGNWDSPL